VLAYTAIDNLRSQAVMERLGLRRDPMLDFDVLYDDVPWHGLVWVAEMRQPVTQV
jgi:RimJ/RimL family protein N-acetyltransferase